MFLGIEIGGTKLQLGVGAGDDAELVAMERRAIDARRGAARIREQIAEAAPDLIRRFGVSRVGFGFGGPVDGAAGRVVKSHQVAGWDGFPLGDWCREQLGVPAVLGNDCDVAALAEARYGAGRGKGAVFYVTVGTGVGGGFVHAGRGFGAGRPAIAEIGHLRPGLAADWPEATVESLAAGPGLAAAARERVFGQPSRVTPLLAGRGRGNAGDPAHGGQPGKADGPRPARTDGATAAGADSDQQDLRRRTGGDPDRLTGKLLAEAAAEGNALARSVLEGGCRVLGWAVAQVVTLLAPEIVVIGGGISLMGEALFFVPVRAAAARYVFPPLAGSYEIVPAALGELAVVHGAVALAAASPRGG